MSQHVTDRERGLYGGRSIARVASSPDGMTVLVGKAAKDNDLVTFKLGRPYDYWFHVAGASGSHVVVLNDERHRRIPKDTKNYAAALAVGYSKARGGGASTVHWTTCGEVRKSKGAPAGQVTLRKYEQTKVQPLRLDED